jgi:hypothetical protein
MKRLCKGLMKIYGRILLACEASILDFVQGLGFGRGGPAPRNQHGGENQMLWLRNEARVGGGATHGGNNRWLLRTEASRASLRSSPSSALATPHRCSCKFLVLFPNSYKNARQNHLCTALIFVGPC